MRQHPHWSYAATVDPSWTSARIVRKLRDIDRQMSFLFPVSQDAVDQSKIRFLDGEIEIREVPELRSLQN